MKGRKPAAVKNANKRGKNRRHHQQKRGIAWMLGTLIAIITIVLVFAVVASLFVRVENSIETWNSKRYAILVANRLSGGSDGLAVTINGMKHKNVFYVNVLDELANNPVYQRWMTPDQDLYCYNWHAEVMDMEEPEYLCPHLQRAFQSFETFIGWSKDFMSWFEDNVPGIKQVNEIAGAVLRFLGGKAVRMIIFGPVVGALGPGGTPSPQAQAAAERREHFYAQSPGVRTDWAPTDLNYGDFKSHVLDWCKGQEDAKSGMRLTWNFGTPTPSMFHALSEVLDETWDEDIVKSLKDTKETLVTMMYNPPSTIRGGGEEGMSTLIRIAPPMRAMMESCANDESIKNQVDPAGVPAIDILSCAKKWVHDKEDLFKEAKPVTFTLPVVIIRKGSFRTLNDDWSAVRYVVEVVKGITQWVGGVLGKAWSWVKCNTVCRYVSIWEKEHTKEGEEKSKGCGINPICYAGKVTKVVWEAGKVVVNNVVATVTFGTHGYFGLPPIRCVKLGDVDCRFCSGCEPPLDAQGPPEITQVTVDLQSDDEIHMGVLKVTAWKSGGECRNVIGDINDNGQIIIGLADRKLTTNAVYPQSGS